ncbi:MAG: hypothetical protein WAX69_18540, partial [Victivallales bacterium]
MPFEYKCTACQAVGELDELVNQIECPNCGGMMVPLSAPVPQSDIFEGEEPTIKVPRGEFMNEPSQPKRTVKVAKAVNIGFGGMLASTSSTGGFSPITLGKKDAGIPYAQHKQQTPPPPLAPPHYQQPQEWPDQEQQEDYEQPEPQHQNPPVQQAPVHAVQGSTAKDPRKKTFTMTKTKTQVQASSQVQAPAPAQKTPSPQQGMQKATQQVSFQKPAAAPQQQEVAQKPKPAGTALKFITKGAQKITQQMPPQASRPPPPPSQTQRPVQQQQQRPMQQSAQRPPAQQHRTVQSFQKTQEGYQQQPQQTQQAYQQQQQYYPPQQDYEAQVRQETERQEAIIREAHRI